MIKDLLQKLSAVFVILVLAVFISTALHTLLSDLYAVTPRQVLASVQEKNYQYRDIDWDGTRRQIQQALSHAPGNPELLHLLGRAHDWQYVSVVY
ncbi:MAG: hypothetical protein R3318_04570, partial [Gammaproteobacteria bacterium]|nr:hypothetical protein [Gammaproteobacteria bacterium]